MIISAVRQSYSVIHIHTSILFQILEIFFFFWPSHSIWSSQPGIIFELQLWPKQLLRQCQILNPLCQASDRTLVSVLQNTTNPIAHSRNSQILLPYRLWQNIG